MSMCNKIKIKDCIIISKESILKNYPKLKACFVNIIKRLYGDKKNQYNSFKIYGFKTSDIVSLEGNNKLKLLSSLANNVGVYIFLNEDCEPVYIGLAGRRNSRNHSLKDRLGIQLKVDLSNSTLANNIKDIERLLQDDKEIADKTEKKDLKKLILEYAQQVLVISTGELNNDEARELTQDLEKILIAFLRPKYNK